MAKTIDQLAQETLGQLMFQLLVTQAQLETAQDKIKELELKLSEKKDE